MKYLAIVNRFGFQKKYKITAVADEAEVKQARKNFYLSGYWTFFTKKPPSRKTVKRWRLSGKVRAVDGCWLKAGEARCKHNQPSWLTLIDNGVKIK